MLITGEVVRVRMGIILRKDDTAGHLFNITGLDFASDLFVKRVNGQYFRLGA